MAEQLANFREESSAKIPALTLLSNLGYTFITPNECEQLRGKLNVGNKTTSTASCKYVTYPSPLMAGLDKSI